MDRGTATNCCAPALAVTTIETSIEKRGIAQFEAVDIGALLVHRANAVRRAGWPRTTTTRRRACGATVRSDRDCRTHAHAPPIGGAFVLLATLLVCPDQDDAVMDDVVQHG